MRDRRHLFHGLKHPRPIANATFPTPRKAPTKTSEAKLIKIADKIANLRDLKASAPADWSEARVGAGIQFAEMVADGCSDVNEKLDAMYIKARGALPEPLRLLDGAIVVDSQGTDFQGAPRTLNRKTIQINRIWRRRRWQVG